MNATPEDIPPPPDVCGIVLDGSEPYLIAADENAALCRSTGIAPADDGTAHPIYHFIATQIGMKYSVAGFCALFDFDVADGPLIVGSTVTFRAPLRIETPYMVRGEILSIARKQSRTLGTMDVAEYRLALYDGEENIAEVTNSWIFPRKART